MIALDTNVVSEPMKADASPAVGARLDGQAVETLYLTALSFAELLVGVEILPAGRRRRGIGAALEELVSSLFGRASCRSIGRPRRPMQPWSRAPARPVM
jgi:predicted nucleic acid-binding protein